ncbi:DUF3563 family protein [Thiomonas sp. FB-Cd]|uniref:DUF3563 family protein n=1 Tax=Thiomonas sp. FB-Cd TaxID=1158292 RepID=UPI00056F011D|nr:DUF3563 family protein [Thiomonas sp. FB-Cd]
MSTLTQFLNKIFPGLESQEELNEDYLAQSVDTADLERRMHDIEYSGIEDAPFPLSTSVPGASGWRPMW